MRYAEASVEVRRHHQYDWRCGRAHWNGYEPNGIESALGIRRLIRSYPVGTQRQRLRASFGSQNEHGFKTAATTRPGVFFGTHRDCLMALPRISLTSAITICAGSALGRRYPQCGRLRIRKALMGPWIRHLIQWLGWAPSSVHVVQSERGRDADHAFHLFYGRRNTAMKNLRR